MGAVVDALCQEAQEFFDVLLHDDRDSMYVVASCDGGQWREHAFRAPALRAFRPKGKGSLYVTRNGFVGKRRLQDRCRQINALMFDLDCHDGNHAVTVPCLVARLIALFDGGSLPRPNLFVNTGRGIQLYYVLEASTSVRTSKGMRNEKGLSYLRDVESGLARRIADEVADLPYVTVDPAVYDLARVGRIPGSYNAKACVHARLLASSRDYFSLAALKAWGAPLFRSHQAKAVKPRTTRWHPSTGPMTQVLTHRARLITKVQDLRSYDCQGDRELMCFLMYNTLKQIQGAKKAFLETERLNARFLSPLPHRELEQIQRSVDSVVIAFGTHRGEVGFYPMTNGTFLKKLALTDEERAAIGRDAHPLRRDRLEAKEATRLRRQRRDESIVREYQKGYTQEQVANRCGCCRRTVSKVVAAFGAKRGNLLETVKAQYAHALAATKKYRCANNRHKSFFVVLVLFFSPDSSPASFGLASFQHHSLRNLAIFLFLCQLVL